MNRIYIALVLGLLNLPLIALGDSQVAEIKCYNHAGSPIWSGVLNYNPEALETSAGKTFIVSGQKLGIINPHYSVSNQCTENSKKADIMGEYTLVCASGTIKKLSGYCYGPTFAEIERQMN
ncbi:MAG: hypothetical protein JNL01_00925 [Bdellovibrionales bacterium]|nr:hypothetical protein [Bdellovibrionales bacterium]